MTNITMYQWAVAAVALVIIFSRTVRFWKRERAQSVIKYVTVVLVWGMIGGVALFPQVAHWIRRTFGFGENFNTLIFITFVILFVLFFRILSIIERIESQITEFIRKESLRELAKKRKK